MNPRGSTLRGSHIHNVMFIVEIDLWALYLQFQELWVNRIGVHGTKKINSLVHSTKNSLFIIIFDRVTIKNCWTYNNKPKNSKNSWHCIWSSWTSFCRTTRVLSIAIVSRWSMATFQHRPTQTLRWMHHYKRGGKIRIYFIVALTRNERSRSRHQRFEEMGKHLFCILDTYKI